MSKIDSVMLISRKPDDLNNSGAPPPRPSCKGDEFTCKERCIPSTWRCDGETDCWKGEDEKECGNEFIDLLRFCVKFFSF